MILELGDREQVLRELDGLREQGTVRLVRRDQVFLLRVWDFFTFGRFADYATTLRFTPWSPVTMAMAVSDSKDPIGVWVLYAHELVHVAQWLWGFGWWGMVRRFLTDAGRLEVEAPAWAMNCIHMGTDVGAVAKELHGSYSIDTIEPWIVRSEIEQQIALMRAGEHDLVRV